MSLLVPCETLTDVSDVSDMSHVKQDENKTENETNGDELNNNSDNDIQKILIETEKNLEKIIKINSTTFDKLVNQFQLSLLKQLKHSLEKLKIDNSNNTNSENESKDMEMIEYNEHKSNTDNLNVNYNATDGSILGDADNLTVVSGATGITGVTGFTGVSSIAASLSIVDPLIIMMGVAEYDGLPYLDSVIKDYDNVIATFVKYWKYKVFYKLNNNKYIYTNNINDIDNNYAVKWDCNDIDSFIEESRKQVVQNKHDGLMFFISSHGDQDDILYDSECEIYELNGIFGMYAAQSSALLQSYSETEQESNHLLSIPKIFFLDMCRGPGKAKVTKIEIGKNQTTTMDVDDGKQETKTVMIDETKEESKPNNEQADNEKKTQTTNSASDPAISLHNKNKTKEKKEETFSLKGINKEDAHTLVGQMANFSKIYANTEGFSVMGGSEHGGIFMRSVCRVFKDTKYVQNHKFTNIIFKIREYTKREATLKNNLVNFTQIVENEGTLERQVVFGSKYISSLFSHSMLNNDALGTLAEENDDDVVDHFGFDQENDSQEKLCITNLSFKNKIAILVEMEQNRENRMKMFETLEKSGVDDNYNSFIENGFVIIDEKYGSHEFVKVWDEYYVTMFALANDGGANTLFDDRKLYFDDYLYFKENKFHTLHESDLLPKCNKVGNECHSLNPVVKASSEMQCRLCSRTINSKSNGDSDNVTSFECKSCQEFLCKDCCVSLIVNKIPQKMQESKYFEMQIVNTSSTYKIAVLINIYDSFYNKERYNMIKSKKYKEIIDEKGFIDNGFLIINNGDKHTFKTVWQSACITVIRIGNGIRDLVFDRQRVLDKYPLYYINTNDDYHDKLIYMKDLAPQIVGLEQKTKKSMEITLKKPLDADTILLECKIQSEITNGIQIVKNQDSTVILDQNDNTCHEMELNIDELEKEFKESQLNYNVKSLVVIDPKNQMQCSLDVMKSVPIFTRIVFDYSCAFTTLNGIGRYGPTNMDEYKGQCHYNDVKLDVKTTRKRTVKRKDNSTLISFYETKKKKLNILLKPHQQECNYGEYLKVVNIK